MLSSTNTETAEATAIHWRIGDIQKAIPFVSKSTIDRVIIKAPTFPRPLYQVGKVRIWDKTEVINWIEANLRGDKS
jgi:hypothetical protein